MSLPDQTENLGSRLSKLTPEKRAALEKLLLQRCGGATSAVPTIQRRKPEDTAPLSFSQQRLWILDQMSPGSSTYNAALALKIVGELNIPVLHAALNGIIERHEVLRTTYAYTNDGPIQVVGACRPVELNEYDLRDVPPERQDEELKSVIQREARRPFDLAQDLMMRNVLLRLREQEYVLVFIAHHIASDGWSREILYQEMAALYSAFLKGQPSPLPELPLHYADFALWQRRRFAGNQMDEQLDFWKKRLADAPEAISLPLDKPRPPRQTFEGAFHWLNLPKELLDGTKAIGQQEHTTLFMTCLAAFVVLLSRYSGQEDILIGSPIANRNQPGVEGLIGFFVNTLVLRSDLSGDPTFREMLARVRETALGAYRHQDVPFEELVRELRPPRTLNRNPLFQVNFRVQAVDPPAPQVPGLSIGGIDIDLGVSRFDMAMELRAKPDGFSGYLEYNTALFDAATIAQMAADFEATIGELLALPDAPLSELPMLNQIAARIRAVQEAKASAKPGGLKDIRRKPLSLTEPVAAANSGA